MAARPPEQSGGKTNDRCGSNCGPRQNPAYRSTLAHSRSPIVERNSPTLFDFPSFSLLSEQKAPPGSMFIRMKAVCFSIRVVHALRAETIGKKLHNFQLILIDRWGTARYKWRLVGKSGIKSYSSLTHAIRNHVSRQLRAHTRQQGTIEHSFKVSGCPGRQR
jgi:hypothetical protein